MISWLFQRVVLGFILAALVGLSVAQTLPLGAGQGSASIAMGQTPCEFDGKMSHSKDGSRSGEVTTSCAIGYGCVAANMVVPGSFWVLARVESNLASQWRVAGLVPGLAVTPEVRPPIRSI